MHRGGSAERDEVTPRGRSGVVVVGSDPLRDLPTVLSGTVEGRARHMGWSRPCHLLVLGRNKKGLWGTRDSTRLEGYRVVTDDLIDSFHVITSQ